VFGPENLETPSMRGEKMAVARDSWPRTLRDAVRVSNRYVLNPVMLRLAGRKHW
jgi:deazaflavin-dependent oxidoreductase (nitroreductase family)